MSCCFSGEIRIVPGGRDARGSAPPAPGSPWSAYTGSRGMPQGAMPGLSDFKAGIHRIHVMEDLALRRRGRPRARKVNQEPARKARAVISTTISSWTRTFMDDAETFIFLAHWPCRDQGAERRPAASGDSFPELSDFLADAALAGVGHLVDEFPGKILGLLLVFDDPGRQQDDELLPFGFVLAAAEEPADDRDLGEEGDARRGFGGVLPDETADHDRLAVLDDESSSTRRSC